MIHQKFPDSQKEPFGPKQIAWIEEKYLRAFFRNGKPMISHDQPARAP